MRSYPTSAKSHAGGRRTSGAAGSREYLNLVSSLYGRKPSTYIPADWRDRLPDPAQYFAAHVEGIGKPSPDGWAACRCPFHADHNASASANLITGGFRCHGCEAKGDLVAFHQRITGLAFKDAVRDLIGSRR